MYQSYSSMIKCIHGSDTGDGSPHDLFFFYMYYLILVRGALLYLKNNEYIISAIVLIKNAVYAARIIWL